MTSQYPPVAIIMRSKDEYPHVERALQGLERQSYPTFALYNVDSGSSDGTWETILAHNTHPDRLLQIPPSSYVPGRVLNLMVAMVREPIVVFLNADAVPLHEDWLERLIQPIVRGEADATMSRQVAREDAHFIVAYDLERAYKRENIEGKNEDFFSAVACAFRRQLWLENRFYVDGYSEDMAWAHACRQKGYRFLLCEDSVVEHSHNYTLAQLYRRGFIEGEADVLIYHNGPQLGQRILRWGKDLVRDFLYTLSKGRIWCIPYNVVYRSAFHWGYLKGRLKASSTVQTPDFNVVEVPEH
ncbi:MAG: glycosyltransferase [Chlamydiia bacterium]|nr:glycosyltransferase [Chlamydiia bacterium]